MAGELFVVARDRPDLYRFFRETFAEASDVQVIWDRRIDDRRRAAVPVGCERRDGDRRRRTTDPELRATGYAFVARDESSRALGR